MSYVWCPRNAIVSPERQVTAVKVNVTYKQTLYMPRWSNLGKAGKKDRELWNDWIARVLRHEMGHVTVNNAYIAAMDGSVSEQTIQFVTCKRGMTAVAIKATLTPMVEKAVGADLAAHGEALVWWQNLYHYFVGKEIPFYE